ncbi:hypothetical protein Tco_0186415 [Tanacetum coccineum]
MSMCKISGQSKRITSHCCEKNPQTQTMSIAIWKKKAPQVPIKYLEANWFVGMQRNSTLLAKIATNEALVQKTPVLKTSFPVAWRILLTFVVQDPSKVTLIKLTASMIEVINRESLVTPLPFSKKKKKRKSQTVTQPKPKSQGPKASRALPQKRKKSKTQMTSLVQTIIKPPSEKVPIDDSNKTHSVSSGQSKTSLEVEPDTDTMIFTTVADIQALLGDSEDELKDVSDEEMLEAG